MNNVNVEKKQKRAFRVAALFLDIHDIWKKFGNYPSKHLWKYVYFCKWMTQDSEPEAAVKPCDTDRKGHRPAWTASGLRLQVCQLVLKLCFPLVRKKKIRESRMNYSKGPASIHIKCGHPKHLHSIKWLHYTADDCGWRLTDSHIKTY